MEFVTVLSRIETKDTVDCNQKIKNHLGRSKWRKRQGMLHLMLTKMPGRQENQKKSSESRSLDKFEQMDWETSTTKTKRGCKRESIVESNNRQETMASHDCPFVLKGLCHIKRFCYIRLSYILAANSPQASIVECNWQRIMATFSLITFSWCQTKCFTLESNISTGDCSFMDFHLG